MNIKEIYEFIEKLEGDLHYAINKVYAWKDKTWDIAETYLDNINGIDYLGCSLERYYCGDVDYNYVRIPIGEIEKVLGKDDFVDKIADYLRQEKERIEAEEKRKREEVEKKREEDRKKAKEEFDRKEYERLKKKFGDK